MWISRTVYMFRQTVCPRCSTFFELYGRTPHPAVNDAKRNEVKAPALSCSTTNGGDEVWKTCHSMLERFRAQLYVNPNHVPAELPRDTLMSIAAALATSPQRRSAPAQSLWKEALELRTHTPTADVRAAADTTAILLHAGKAALGYDMGLELLSLHRTGFRQRVMLSSEVEDALRFLSAFVMCAAEDHRSHIPASLLPVFQTALQNAKNLIASADKSKRSGLAHGVEILAWSVDWFYGNQGNDGAAAAEALLQLRPLFPQWLLFLCAPFDAAVAEESSSSFALLSPRWLCEMARCAGSEGDHQRLEKLLRHAQRAESLTPGYCIFQLSARMADMLVSGFPHLPASSQAVATYGTALHRDALRHFGTTKGGLNVALDVLKTMTGAEPYFVLRDLMRHQSTEVAAATQETAGDVLTGNAQLNWSTALRFTMHEVEAANPHWRMYLPETLRLLSDAGQTRLFWRLLQEYNMKEGGANLSVAASLAQVMGRTGKWWHAMEVLDLVAAAPPPRSAAEDSFLASACVDTLRALLRSKRWQEALEVLAIVGNAVPAHEVAVVSQLLTSLPAGAPWTAVLQLASSEKFTVHNTATLLSVLYDSAASPLQLSPAQLRVAVPIFVQHGRWDLMRPLVEHHGGDVRLWLGLVQSLEHCPHTVDEAVGTFVVSSLPPALAHATQIFSRVAQLCLQHGWYNVLASHLRTSSSTSTELSSLSKEYEYLLLYLRRGARPPLTFVFADTYVIHQFISCVAARQLAVVALLPAEVAVSTKHASAYLRVPHDNLRSLHCGRAGSSGSSVKVYSTAAITFLQEHVLHRGSGADGLLFGYKVPGVSLFAAARGMTQLLRLPGVYMVVYNMSAASSGVFVLHPASTSLRLFVFTLHVRLCLAGLADAPFVPLLATSFFKDYNMTWHGGTTERHEVEAVIVVENGLDVKTALRTLKRDINAEGWGLVETEAGAGDLYHITQVRYAPRTPANGVCDVQVVMCRLRGLQPINADTDTEPWQQEV